MRVKGVVDRAGKNRIPLPTGAYTAFGTPAQGPSAERKLHLGGTKCLNWASQFQFGKGKLGPKRSGQFLKRKKERNIHFGGGPVQLFLSLQHSGRLTALFIFFLMNLPLGALHGESNPGDFVLLAKGPFGDGPAETKLCRN